VAGIATRTSRPVVGMPAGGVQVVARSSVAGAAVFPGASAAGIPSAGGSAVATAVEIALGIAVVAEVGGAAALDVVGEPAAALVHHVADTPRFTAVNTARTTTTTVTV